MTPKEIDEKVDYIMENELYEDVWLSLIRDLLIDYFKEVDKDERNRIE